MEEYMEEDSKKDYYTISTWNVHSLNPPGKLSNIIKEMVWMDITILGVSETFRDGEADFTATIPNNKEKFRVICSGGEKKRRGVCIILREKFGKSVLNYKL